ncbi:MAG: energy transducer TonB, partial [Chromatiales bacterium]
PKAKAPTRPAAAKPAAPTPQKPAKPAPAEKAAPVDPPLGDLEMDSPIDEGLASAFGDDDTSFTETVTGLFSSINAKLKGDSSEPPASPDESAMNIPSGAPAGGAGGASVKNPKIIGIAAVVVVAVAAATFFFVGGDDDTATMTDPVADSAAPLVTESDSGVTESSQSSPDVDALVEEARLARDAGQIFNPAGSNAIELYVAAVNADPSNVLVVAELDAVIQQALQMAESALLDSRVDDAAAALQRVSVADPSNSRLPFLSAQLWQMQLRSHLTNARAAIRDERFEDAGNALAAAIALNLGDTGEIEEVRAELSRARSAQEVGGVLGKANARLQEGNLLSPPNDNARYYYELLLASDPANTAARQGLDAVASKVVLQARTEIDAGNLDAAANLLGQARAIDPASNELDATAAALSAARDAIAARIREAEEERLRIQAANRQAAADKAAAEQAAAEQAAAEQAAAEQAAAERRAAEEAAALAAAAKPGPGDATSNAAGAAAETASQPVAQQPTPEPRPVAVRGNQSPVSVSSLSRTRYVAPKYPRTAQRRNQSGWVDVVFTVAMDGSVKDLQVRNADPEGVFDSAALKAVEKWEFEPVIENGVLVEKRAGVRMMFALE